MFSKLIWILIRLGALPGSDLGICHFVKITPSGPRNSDTKGLWYIFINVAHFSIPSYSYLRVGCFETVLLRTHNICFG